MGLLTCKINGHAVDFLICQFSNFDFTFLCDAISQKSQLGSTSNKHSLCILLVFSAENIMVVFC